MKIIEVDEELYQYIASQTQSIGESASDILRRLLNLSSSSVSSNPLALGQKNVESEQPESAPLQEKRAGKKSDVFVEQPLKSVAKKRPQKDTQQLIANVSQLLNSTAFQQENKAVNRFLSLLATLYHTSPERFAVATEAETVQGRTRLYFARDEATLLASGNHTKPKQIPDTPYWVITNNNSGRKMIMLDGIMREMQLPAELIEQVRAYFVVN